MKPFRQNAITALSVCVAFMILMDPERAAANGTAICAVDSRTVLAGYHDGSVRSFSVEELHRGENAVHLLWHARVTQSPVVGIASVGSALVVAGLGGECVLVSAAGRKLREFVLPRPTRSLAGQGGGWVFFAARDVVGRWDVQASVKNLVHERGNEIQVVAVGAEEALVYGDDAGCVYFWPRRAVARFTTELGAPIQGAAVLSPVSAVVSTSDGALAVLELRDGGLGVRQRVLAHRGSAYGLAAAVETGVVVSTGVDRTIQVRRMANGVMNSTPASMFVFDEREQHSSVVALSPDGRLLAAVTVRDKVKVFRVDDDRGQR